MLKIKNASQRELIARARKIGKKKTGMTQRTKTISRISTREFCVLFTYRGDQDLDFAPIILKVRLPLATRGALGMWKILLKPFLLML